MSILFDALLGSDEAKRKLAIEVAQDLTRAIVQEALSQLQGKSLIVTIGLDWEIGDEDGSHHK